MVAPEYYYYVPSVEIPVYIDSRRSYPPSDLTNIYYVRHTLSRSCETWAEASIAILVIREQILKNRWFSPRRIKIVFLFHIYQQSDRHNITKI